ncbi:MAG TPA: DUF1501 domain-containing protein [Polyangiaceae bacterium]|nr:DUF1501 domain-containing protein [Polyangiaceae bacterium]
MTMTTKKSFQIGRRGVLGAAATVTGGLILRSLATGIPAKVLLDPMSATAQDMPTGRMLILSSSSAGDPVNANVPGTYGYPELYHPEDPLMAETNLSLGGLQTSAAKPWADLPQNILDRTLFFHHATYTPVHGEMNRVQRMMDATEKKDMLISLLARELAPGLGTVQADPVSLGANGGELLTSGGRILGNVAPLSVRQALGGVEGPLKDLTAMRDESIDEIYALYRDHGTPSQRTLLDAWARSRDEVRSISTELVSRLEAIDGNNQVNQVRCAAILAAMKITPVVTIRLDFGRDNHTDAGLTKETVGHLASIPAMQSLMEELDQLRTEGILQHDVVVGSLNVFGRTLKKKGTTGRDHNAGHHVTVLMGNGVKPGIVGGVELNGSGKEYIAQSIDSATGAGGGDIPFEETLGAMGKTLGAIMGVDAERLDEILPPGKIVQSAVG